jgi:23S rRNA U2552 (ribose-2'-O)-methylase RlmE/FtsJ
MMEQNVKMKKIYITDTIINKNLLKTSIDKLLKKNLSNVFYKYKDITYKVNNIVNKINLLYSINEDGKTIYNLAYQPYNEYNIFNDYKNNNFDKKWILPIVNETKILFISDLVTDKYGEKIRNYEELKHSDNEEKTKYKIGDNSNILYIENSVETEDIDITYPNSNKFMNYNKTNEYNELNKPIKEVPTIKHELKDFSLYSSTNTITNKIKTKCIRIAESNDECYFLDNKFEVIDKSKDIGLYKKSTEICNSQVRNILKNEDINVNKFIIFDTMQLLDTNFNIYLGNSISYINEIINQNYFYSESELNGINLKQHYTSIYENSIEIKSDNETKTVNYQVINSIDLNLYKNDKNKFIYNYFDIIQNLNINTINNIYTIRDIKYIYNMYNYDLNKIPYCYIEYLKDILDNNTKQYILENTSINKYLFESYENYKKNKTEKEFTPLTILKNIYNFDNLYYNNENIFEIIFSNTFDLGILYNLHEYDKYLNTLEIVNPVSKESIEQQEDPCKNYKIVAKFQQASEINKRQHKFYDIKYATKFYLIQYIDIIDNINIHSDDYEYDNIFDCSLNDIEFDNKKQNSIKKINSIANQSHDKCIEILNFIKEHKIYIYSLLLNLESDTDVLFHAIQHYKYKGKYYVIIPYESFQVNNLIYIGDDLYKITSIDPEIGYDKYENDAICKFNEVNETVINEEYQTYLFNSKNIDKYNTDIKELNELDIHYITKNVADRIEHQTNRKDFYNFKQDKYKHIKKSTFHLKTLRTLEYRISTDINIEQQVTQYFRTLNIGNYNQKLESNMITIIQNSKYNTEITQNINYTSNLISKKMDGQILTNICKYLNDYELFTNIIYNPNKYNRAYFKLYELLMESNILNSEDFKLISLAEAPGDFVNCIKTLKNQINPEWGKSENDYKILTKLDDIKLVQQGNFMKIHKNNIYNVDTEGFDGDLTKSSVIKSFVETIIDKNLQANLITADGGIEKNDTIEYQLEEYNHIPLFFGEIITAIHTQKRGGMFILKMYDIIYENSINLLYILKAYYTSVNIVKPYNSRPCNTEKYIVCKDFIGNYDEVIFNNMLKILDKLSENLEEREQRQRNKDKKEQKIEKIKSSDFNILQDIELDTNFISDIEYFNNSIVLKTRELYLQKAYNMSIPKEGNLENKLIDTYFSRGRGKLDYLIDNLTDDSVYFSHKIEQSILLANHMKINIKPHLIEYYDKIKQLNICLYNEECNIVPIYFKEINEAIYSNNILKLQKLAKQYCITFENFNDNSVLDYNIYKEIDTFINNDNIKIITHPLIKNLKAILKETDKNKLKNYLIDICKISNIYKIFNIYQDKIKENIISAVTHFQINLKYLLGYYLCKNTYIPLFPKYKYYINLQDQLKYSILYNSHYICFYSGDKLEKEEFDEFMGENIYRSIDGHELELFTNIQQKNTDKLEQIINKKWIDDLNIPIEHNICLFILNIFTTSLNLKLEDTDKIAILKNIHKFSNLHYDSIILDKNELKTFLTDYIYKLINEKYNYHIFALLNDLDEIEDDDYHPQRTCFNTKNEENITEYLTTNENLRNIYNNLFSTETKNEKYKEDKFHIQINEDIKKQLYKTIITQLIKEECIKKYQNIILYTISILSIKSKSKKSIEYLIKVYYKNERELIKNIIDTYINNIDNIKNNIEDIFEKKITLNIDNDLTFDILQSYDVNKILENIKLDILEKYLHNITYGDQDQDEDEKNMKWYRYYKRYNDYIIVLKDVLEKENDIEEIKEIQEQLNDLKTQKLFENLTKINNKEITIYNLLNNYKIILNESGIDFNLYKYFKSHITNTSTQNFFKTHIKENIQIEDIDTPQFYLKDIFHQNLVNSISYIQSNINLDDVLIDNTIKPSNENKIDNLVNITNIIYKPKYTSIDIETHQLNDNLIYNNKILYLLIHVYEANIVSPKLINKKRLFKKNEDEDENEYKCIYTNQTKLQILTNILGLVIENTFDEIYNNTISRNLIILNNKNLVHKNVKNDLNNDNLLNNLIYKFNNDDIQLIYKFIKLFYNYLVEKKQNVDLLQNILMSYSSDPINYIIQFKKLYEENYMDNIQEFLIKYNLHSILDIINKKTDIKAIDENLFKLKQNDITYEFIRDKNLLQKFKKDKHTQKIFNLFESYEKKNSTGKKRAEPPPADIILIINTIKKILLFIINLPLDITPDIINIKSYIKNKFTFIKYLYKYYEFNKLIDNIYDNLYKLLLNNKNILNLQIVFDNILEEFNYNFNNIYCLDDKLSMILLLYKLLNIISKVHNLIIGGNYKITPEFKQRYFWASKQSSRKLIQFEEIKSLSNEIDLENTESIYSQLFNNILNISIENIKDYSNSINEYEVNTEISQEIHDIVDNDQLSNFSNIYNNIGGTDNGNGEEN